VTRPRRRLPSASRAAAAAVAALALAGLALVPAGAAAAVSAAPAADAPAPDHSGLQYVALGDSYSAGYGLDPYSFTTPADGCFQADANYPKLVAATLGLTLDDRTCSGAVTANIRDTPQRTLTGEGTAPVQSEFLSADTDLVTVTIGGNDLGFADVAAACVALSPTGPVLGSGFDTCAEYYNPVPEVDLLADRIDDVVTPALAETFALIAEKAPNAQVIVVGYPAIAPNAANVPQGGCFSPAITSDGPPYPANAFPYTARDTTYLHDTEGKLDAAIRTQAELAGAHYIPTMAETDANSACQTNGSAYVNGVTILFQAPGTHVGGTPTPDPLLFVKYGALHPNAAGVGYLADRVTAEARALLAPDPGEEPPVTEPTDPPATDPAAPPVDPADPGAAAPAGAARPALASTGATVLPLALLGGGLVAAALVLLVLRRRTR
jgi:lysophospholipase L1-like esterase